MRIEKTLRELSVFLLFLLLAVGLTWPLAIRLPTAVPDLGDPLLNTWIIDWVGYALTHDPLSLFDAPMFYPSRMPLAFSENLIGVALFAIPFQLAGVAPLTVYNILFLLGFALSGYGAFVLARLVTGATLPSIVGGIFFAFVSYKFDHLSHLQIIWSGWLPLILAALIAYWRRPTMGRAGLVFGAFLMNGLTNIHFLLFGGLAALVAIGALGAFEPRRDRRFWIQLFGSLALAGLVLLPVLLPYRHVADLYGMKRERPEVEWGSAEIEDWLHTTTRSRIYGRHQPEDIRHERTLFPGLVPLFLLGAAIVMTRRETLTPPLRAAGARNGLPMTVLLRTLDVLIVITAALTYFGAVTERFVITWDDRIILAIRGVDIPMTLLVIFGIARLLIRFPGKQGRSLRTAVADSRFSPEAWTAATWIVLGFIGSLGLNAFLHTFLYQRAPGFEALRVPARWAVVAYVGLAVWSAIGAKVLMRRRVMQVVLPLLMIVDVLPTIRWEHAPVQVPPFYRWLAETRVGPVLELPPQDEWAGQFIYLLHATQHRVPIMNGTSGFEPPAHRYIRDAYVSGTMNERFTRFLERNGAKLVVLHGDALSRNTERVTDWVREAMTSGRLAFVRRFDNGLSGDWVFAVTQNLPDWRTYSDYGSEERVTRFLEGQPTYNRATFGRMESPAPWETQTRQLRVSGWALSPHGIRSATALIDNGRLRIPMSRFQRPDVHAQFPWYRNVAEPGLIATLPKRPKGTPRDTDVQIEIVDGAGKVTRLRGAPFRWN
ncbi:MAG TPA: hypothetical protein VFT12_04905 [Thermoanaerobaculia bacterium]|nr:hypothetical protein [Thermoanaerobaculia bacterium]